MSPTNKIRLLNKPSNLYHLGIKGSVSIFVIETCEKLNV